MPLQFLLEPTPTHTFRLDSLFGFLNRAVSTDPTEDLVREFTDIAATHIPALFTAVGEAREEAARNAAYCVTHALLSMRVDSRKLGEIVAQHLGVSTDSLISELARPTAAHEQGFLMHMTLMNHMIDAGIAHDKMHDDALACQHLSKALLLLWRELADLDVCMDEFYSIFNDEIEEEEEEQLFTVPPVKPMLC